MEIRTGQTIYENIVSVDADNNPISATTFDIVTYEDGALFYGILISVNLIDDSRGLFSASWSADTTGEYQMYFKNNSTNVIFMSDSVSVLPDSAFENNIYIGL